MIENSKKWIVRRSMLVLLTVGFLLASSSIAVAETGYPEDVEDVGVVDVYDDIYDPDAAVDDVGVDPDAAVDDVGVDPDAALDDDAGDISEEFDGGDVEAGDVEQNTDAGHDFLYVELGVEVQFDGEAPDVVTLGLRADFGEVLPIEVAVSEQGLAVWDVDALRAGTWILSATADGYEPMNYRFAAGDMSQMKVHVLMSPLGSFAKTKVESGWACSAVAADAGPSTLVFMAALVGGMWIQRRRKA